MHTSSAEFSLEAFVAYALTACRDGRIGRNSDGAINRAFLVNRYRNEKTVYSVYCGRPKVRG
jgi:hypothetical protein